MSYTTLQRWHASWNAPLIETDWRITDLPFIEGQILLGNRWCQDDQDTVLRVGEAPTWAAPRTNRGLEWIPGGLNGKHVCHAEWFATGEPWPTSLPDTVYGGDGWPLCCMAGTDAAAGGVEVGGAAGDKHTTTDATYGGLSVGGSAGDAHRVVDPAAGGVVVGGEAGDAHTTIDASAGGVVVGGAAGDSHTTIDPAAGGVVVGGKAGDAHTVIDAAEGGVEVGGAAGDVWGWVDAAEGGVEVGGAAGDAHTVTDPAAGGVQLGGAAGDVLRYTDGASGGTQIGGAAGDLIRIPDASAGGVVVGGSAGDVFTPGQPTPGTNCAGSATVNQTQTYSYSISAGGNQQWFTFTLPSTGTWHIATTGLGGFGASTLSVYSGGSCPTPNLLLPTTAGPPRWVWNGTAGDVIRMQFNVPLSGTTSYTFDWDSGS